MFLVTAQNLQTLALQISGYLSPMVRLLQGFDISTGADLTFKPQSYSTHYQDNACLRSLDCVTNSITSIPMLFYTKSVFLLP